jgi:hypothetical protein
MKVRITEFTREYVVREFNLTQAVLDEWEVTAEEVAAYAADPTSVSDELHDILLEMFADIEYDVFDEDSHHDGEEIYIVE